MELGKKRGGRMCAVPWGHEERSKCVEFREERRMVKGLNFLSP